MATNDDCVAADAVGHTVYRWLVAACVCCLSLAVFGCRNRASIDAAQQLEAEIPSSSTSEAFHGGNVYDESGHPVQIRKLSNQKHLLILVTRGRRLDGDLESADCQSCIGQTTELADHGQQFTELNCEVVIVVPTLIDGPQTVRKFREALAKKSQDAARLPMYYDPDFTWSKQLGITIQDEYAHRSAFLLNEDRKLIKINIVSSLIELWSATDFTRTIEAVRLDL